MIYTFECTDKDKEMLNSIDLNKPIPGVKIGEAIVIKPWGREYLNFECPEIAVWMLHISSEQSTSFHCHPNKDTTLIVLEANHGARFKYSKGELSLFVGDIVSINKGAFHQTTSIIGRITVMEIETPNNKNDLVRYEDKYGRV